MKKADYKIIRNYKNNLDEPNKGETAVHGCHCPSDMVVRMCEGLARPWVDVCVPLVLSLSLRTHVLPLCQIKFQALLCG